MKFLCHVPHSQQNPMILNSMFPIVSNGLLVLMYSDQTLLLRQTTSTNRIYITSLDAEMTTEVRYMVCSKITKNPKNYKILKIKNLK